MLSPFSNYTVASFSLFILKILYKCVRDSILREKEECFNEKLEAGNRVLDEVNKKLQNTLRNRNLTTVSVAHAMIEMAHKKIKKC